ncbi:MAG: HAD family hydrolase [Schwartzia succinivorans]|nr:HAD family hydrolase [Schwartzia succinivorans]
MAVIFDLDLTLVDTASLKPYRDRRAWREIPSHLAQTSVYPGVLPVLTELNERRIPVAVVTDSPGVYAKSLLEYHRLPIRTLVAYHDVKRHKPYPDPMLRAAQLLRCPPSQAISIGDAAKDVAAARAAGMCACAALWGCADRASVEKSAPDYMAGSLPGFLAFVLRKHGEYARGLRLQGENAYAIL